jgi:hypothetical protein
LTALLTPLEFGTARQVGATLWRKQLLPLGEITYKDRKIAFSRDYLTRLVQAFRDKAYDAVPLQFADHANSHTNDPERRRGTVRDLELTDDGLDVLVEVGPETAKRLAEFPDLGVSARIVEGYDRADGRFFPAAVQHVLATLDPRIPGMRPWQAVEAANDDAGEVIDLTETEAAQAPQDGAEQPAQQPPAETGTPATEESTMALTADQESRLGKLLDLPDDKFDAFLAAATAEPEADAELTDAELEELLASPPDEGNENGDGSDDDGEGEAEASEEEAAQEREPVGASLTAEAQAAIDLANSRADENALELAGMRAALNKATFEKERDFFSREYGIPPRITDLARPVLEGEGHVVELANGSSIDAGAIVRKMLKEVGQTVRMLDLSGELGTPLDFSAEAEKAEQDKATENRKAIVSEMLSGKYGL